MYHSSILIFNRLAHVERNCQIILQCIVPLYPVVQDLFHFYLNKCEFQFLRLHINKTNTFCFLLDNGRVTDTTK